MKALSVAIRHRRRQSGWRGKKRENFQRSRLISVGLPTFIPGKTIGRVEIN